MGNIIGLALFVIAFVVIAYCDLKHIGRQLEREKEEREKREKV